MILIAKELLFFVFHFIIVANNLLDVAIMFIIERFYAFDEMTKVPLYIRFIRRSIR